MADRKQQLLDAYTKEEEGEDIETVEEEELEGTEAESEEDEHSSDDPPVVESDESEDKASKEADASAGKTPDKGDGKRLGKKSGKAGSDLGDAGKLSKPEGVSKKADAPKGGQKAPVEKTLDQIEKEAAEAAADAPKSWRPVERETWGKIPKEARDAIQRRETEITQFIGQHGKAIQHKAQFDEMVQPFMPFIAAQQSTPLKAFHGLMTTAARLTTGAPQQKAQVIAEIMRNYGIDVKTLDEVLSAQMQGGGQPSFQPQNAEPPAWARPMFDFMRETTQARKEHQDRTQREAADEIAAFEKKPFFSDLKDDIALVMERATAKGQKMTLDQAYAKARKMNPEVDAILTQREKAAAAANGGSAVEKARKAASTVRGAPGAGGVVTKTNGKANDGKPVDRRAALSAAFDDLSQE